MGLADVAAWMNRRYYRKGAKPYAGIFVEKDLVPIIEDLVKKRLRPSLRRRR